MLVYLDYSPDRANCSNCHNNGGADLKQVYDRRAVTPFYAKYDEYLRSNPRFRLTTGNIPSVLQPSPIKPSNPSFPTDSLTLKPVLGGVLPLVRSSCMVLLP